jgi:hypothetical protein
MSLLGCRECKLFKLSIKTNHYQFQQGQALWVSQINDRANLGNKVVHWWTIVEFGRQKTRICKFLLGFYNLFLAFQLKKQFPSFFVPFDNEPVFGMRFPPTFIPEFVEVIRDITEVDEEHGNPAKAYAIFELTDGVPTPNNLPLCGRYSGSETDSAQNNADFNKAIAGKYNGNVSCCKNWVSFIV